MNKINLYSLDEIAKKSFAEKKSFRIIRSDKSQTEGSPIIFSVWRNTHTAAYSAMDIFSSWIVLEEIPVHLGSLQNTL